MSVAEPRDPGPIEAQPVAGCVTLIVPPLSPMPHGEIIPPAPYLLGAKDTATGQLRPGVLGIHLRTWVGQLEVTVDLDEIANEDGTPAVTREQVHTAVVRHNPAPGTWPVGAPTVRSRFRVDGFELGQVRGAFVDGERLMRDVREVKRALGLPIEDKDGA